MAYFKQVQSFEDLKKQYKKLAFQHHPDAGGNTEAMQEINAEFEGLFIVWKNTTKLTVHEFTNEFYTQNGWKGSRYNVNLSTKDIAKLMRTFVKVAYPLCKFSITRDYNSINITLMECNYNPFNGENKGHMQLNHYYLKENKGLTEQAKEMLININNYLQSFNRNDSDAMIDYFDTNFYTNIHIGKWDKDFKIVDKIIRITSNQTETKVTA